MLRKNLDSNFHLTYCKQPKYERCSLHAHFCTQPYTHSCMRMVCTVVCKSMCNNNCPKKSAINSGLVKCSQISSLLLYWIGAYMVVKIIIEMVRMKLAGSDDGIGSLIKDLEEPFESVELRMNIISEPREAKAKGVQAIETFRTYIEVLIYPTKIYLSCNGYIVTLSNKHVVLFIVINYSFTCRKGSLRGGN